MDPKLDVLVKLTEVLTQATVAAPVVFALVQGLATTIRMVTGSGPSAAEVADTLEAKLDANDADIRAEIARLKAL